MAGHLAGRSSSSEAWGRSGTDPVVREREAQLAAEADALARLNDASSRLWRARTLREGLEEMLTATIALLGADMGNVQLLDAADGVLRIVAQRGFDRPFLDFFREVSAPDDSACGRALRAGERQVIPDVELDAAFASLLPIARTAGFRAVQSTPLIGREGAPLGMLSTHWRAPHQPSEQDLRRLDLFVRQAVEFIERCRADEALAEMEARFQAFLDHSPARVYLKDAEGRYVFVNQAVEQVVGRPAADCAGKSDADLHPPDVAARLRENDRRVLEEGRALEFVERLAQPDGEHQFFSVKFPVRDRFGRPYTGGISYDVTAQMRAEEEIVRLNRELERRVAELQAILSVVPMGVAIAADPACRTITLNPYMSELLGVPPDANASLSAPAAERPSSYTNYRDGRELPPEELPMQVACTGVEVRDFEVELVRTGGDSRHLLCSARPLLDSEGQVRGSVGAFLDITERRSAEKALRASEALFRTLGEAVPNLLWMSDAAGRPLYQNPAWRAYTGMSPEALTRGGWESLHHPDDLPALQQAWKAALASGEALQVECRLRRHDGEYRWFAARTVPLKDSAGQVLNWVGTLTDIHDVQMARQALQEADRRKDEFLAMLAHELRNPLAPIRNAVTLLKQLGPAEPRLTRAREIIERQVVQQARLLDDLLDVSRITRGKIALRPQRLDLARLVQVAAEDCRPLIEAAGLTLRLSLPEEPLWVDGDPVRLAQVVANLLQNSAKFTDRGGEVAVTLARASGGASPVAVVTVSDTGIGIAPEMLARVFETFAQADHSLERARGGLGLGLALVKGLVELHGGAVQVESAGLGQGAQFTIRLPLSAAPPAAAAAPAPGVRPLGPIRVLVVEDNRDAAESLRDLLELAGCQVGVVFSGSDAVAAALRFRPGVVICDLGLPGLNGYRVAAALRADPSLAKCRLIAVSGYGQEKDRKRSRQAGFDLHLTKPVEFEELQRVLSLPPEEQQGG